MKRRLIYNVVGVLAMLLMMGACQEEDWGNQVSDINCLTLELSTTAASRVPVVGDDRFNENEVERVDVYFFADGGSGNCLYAQTGLVPEGSVLQVVLDKNRIQDNNTYYIYVVANCDLGITNEIAVNYTLDGLKDIIVSTQWKNGTNTDDAVESSLVMDGNSSVKVTAKGAEGHVILVRAMAKVMLYTSTEKELTVNGMTYTPVPERMFVTMYNSVTKTNLGDDYQVNSSADYLTGGIRRNYDAENPEEVPAKEIDEDADEDAEPYNRYEQVAPFYSYPNPQETTDRKDTYLMLCVPWTVRQSDGDGSYQAVNYYYRVPITGNANPALMARNQYYRINVHIGVLGSVNPEDAIEITNANFEIYDWFEVGIDTGMEQYQYLVLDEYSSVMNNVDELQMPYASSSSLVWSDTEGIEEGKYTKIVSVSYPDYSDEETRIETLTNADEIKDAGFFIEKGQDETLIFRHVIPDDAFVPYTITIQVFNKQGISISEPWIIRQYPDIYIEAKYNSNGRNNRFVFGQNEDTYNRQVEDDSGMEIGTVLDLSRSDDQNPNQYIIYITSFEVGDNYIIGDPRTLEVDPMTYEDRWGNEKKHFNNLNNYYSTRSDDVSRVIPPAFMIASSWAGTSGHVDGYENAKARCAAYQENGYPAGRWRMPTEAEIEYIMALSEAGEIPQLLQRGSPYWSSSGRIIQENEWTANETSAFIRCVYDIWYWGDKKISELPEEDKNGFTDTDFVWGDEGELRKGN